MKKKCFLIGFFFSTLSSILAQISQQNSFDPSLVKITESVNEFGDSIISLLYPNLMHVEEGGIQLPSKEYLFLVPADATAFNIEVKVSEEIQVDLPQKVSLNIDEIIKKNGLPVSGSSSNPHVRVLRSGYYAEITLIENGVQVFPKASIVKIKTNTATYSPMVVEGRTWWYETDYFPSYIREIGYRIGSPVVIEDTLWYPVNQIRLATKELYWSDDKGSIVSSTDKWCINDTPQHVCYIRQEGNRIFSRFSWELCPISEPLSSVKVGPFINLLPGYTSSIIDYDLMFEVYGEENTEFEYKCIERTQDPDMKKTEPQKALYQFTKITEITNSDNNYDCFNFINTDYTDYVRGSCSGMTIPQFGWIMDINDNSSDLFFAPQGTMIFSASDYDTMPRLRYVTDADNNILFEHKGGFKLWELMEAGAENVIDELKTADLQWYTIDGRIIDQPSTPGLYLYRIGSKTQKVVIR